MTKALVTVPNLRFDKSIRYPEELFINKLLRSRRVTYRDISFLFFSPMGNGDDHYEILEHRRELNLLLMERDRFHNALTNRNTFVPKYLFKCLLKQLPQTKRFIKDYVYEPNIIPIDIKEIEIKGWLVRGELVSYLIHLMPFGILYSDGNVHSEILSGRKIIQYLMKVFENEDSDFDFDEYINDWIERLLHEYPIPSNDERDNDI